MDETKIIDGAKQIVNDFLTQMGLDAEVRIEFMESDQDQESLKKYLMITMQGDNLGELVGYHGKNLEAIQVLMTMMINKKFPEERNLRLVVDINEYIERRKKYLRNYALQAIEQVKSSGQSMELPAMKPFERRIIHMTLKNEAGVQTESVGEGEDRHIIISKAE